MMKLILNITLILSIVLLVAVGPEISGKPLFKLSFIDTAHAGPRGGQRSAHRTTRPRSGRTSVNVNRSVDVNVRRRPRVGAVAAGIAIGTRIARLPRGCRTVVTYNVTYHQCAGVYYRPYYQGTNVVYVVVDAP